MARKITARRMMMVETIGTTIATRRRLECSSKRLENELTWGVGSGTRSFAPVYTSLFESVS